MTTTPAMSRLGLLVQWQARRLAGFIPMVVVVQALLTIGPLLGFGLLFGYAITPEAAAYLGTGATTLSLIMLGLVMVPQNIGQSRTEGSFDWMRTLPLPRWSFLVADLVLYTLITLPGIVLAVWVGAWRFDLDLAISPWMVLAAPLVSLIATIVGYSLALVLDPKSAQLISQVLVFVVLMFSPISYPAANLPGWFQQVHLWLPFQPMGEAIRAVLMSHDFTMPGRSAAVLAAWTAVAAIGAGRALTRRG
jgi:ABC-2 type transport system permease protein